MSGRIRRWRRARRAPLEVLIPAAFVLVVAICSVDALVLPVAAGTARVVVMAIIVSGFALWARDVIAAIVTASIAWCAARILSYMA